MSKLPILLAVAITLASCSRTADPPDPAKLKAAGWVRLGSDRTVDLWILTTTYYCADQPGVECPPESGAIAARELGDDDVYGSEDACKTAAEQERTALAKAAQAVAPLQAKYRADALSGKYVPPDWLMPRANPQVACERYRVTVKPGLSATRD